MRPEKILGWRMAYPLRNCRNISGARSHPLNRLAFLNMLAALKGLPTPGFRCTAATG